MKKTLRIVSLLCLVMVVLFAFAGCNANDKIKKNFEDAGYEVSSVIITEDSDAYSDIKNLFGEEEADKMIGYELITVSKSIIENAMIIAYPSANELKEELGEDYQSAVDDGKVNGNCYLLYNIGNNPKDIFKK